MNLISDLSDVSSPNILFAHTASNLIKDNKVDDAIQLCENGLKKYPAYAQGHFILSQCYQKKNMKSEARAELERVVKYDPSHLRALDALAKIHKESGLNDIYREYMQKLLTLDPLRDEVIEEAKKLGFYGSGIEKKEEIDVLEEKEKEIEPFEEAEEFYNPHLDETTELPKFDLSQFNNRDDDFTTIIEGKEWVDQVQKVSNKDFPETEKSADKNELKESQDNFFDENIGLDEQDISTIDNIPDERSDRDAWGTFIAAGKKDSVKRPIPDTSFDMEEEKLSSNADDLPQVLNLVEEENQKSDDQQLIQHKPPVDNNIIRESRVNEPKIISQTLGEILVSQKKYPEALKVFKSLKEQQPTNMLLDKKISFLEKIIALENK